MKLKNLHYYPLAYLNLQLSPLEKFNKQKVSYFSSFGYTFKIKLQKLHILERLYH